MSLTRHFLWQNGKIKTPKKIALLRGWGVIWKGSALKCRTILFNHRLVLEKDIYRVCKQVWNWIETVFEIELNIPKLEKVLKPTSDRIEVVLRSTSLSCSLPARTCWVTQYAVLAVNVDDRKCQRFLEERPLVRYFSLRTHPEKTKNNWPLSTIDIEREKICQWSFFSSFFNVFINIPVAHWT